MKILPTSLDGPFLFRIASFVVYHFFLIPLTFIIWFCVYGMRIRGRKNLRGHHKGFIAANHCLYVEVGFTAFATWPKKVLYGSERINVTRKDFGWIARLLRTFILSSNNIMATAVFIKKALKKNWFVLFYPERSLNWRCQTPGPFFDGVFFFAFVNNVPVFPIVEVLHERLIRKVLPWWPPRTTLVIGAPFYPDDFRKPGLSKREQIHLMSQAVRGFMTTTIAEEGGCTTLPESRQTPLP